MAAIALIPTDLEKTWLGLGARLGDSLAGRSVLEHTVRRVARIDGVDRIVLVHPKGQDPMPLLNGTSLDKPVLGFADPGGLADPHRLRWVSARKWALGAWRGGLGNATAYDELLPARPLVDAIESHRADSALIVRCDWCLIDPDYAGHILALHLDQPEGMQVTFTQAPPGLCGIVTCAEVLRQIRDHHASFGTILGYNPRAPTVDPIGREVNHPIPASVRDCNRRFVYDTPRSRELIRAICHELGDRFADANAAEVTQTCRTVESTGCGRARLPQQVSLELTPRRAVTGPITPQHHVAFDRPNLDLDLARRVVEQLGDDHESAGAPGCDVALLLGGLGDALLHPQWDQVVLAARDAGVLGIGVETDLLCDHDDLDRMLELPIDVIAVHLNADTAAVYERAMGADRFKKVIGNLQWLFNQRNRRSTHTAAPADARVGLPWIVPSLVKTAETLPDMESFFDKWVIVSGHAVIEPARCGCGLMPHLSPVSMAPPRRRPCRQLGRRMSILSDGTVAQCDQDWLGRAPLGDARLDRLCDIWAHVRQPSEAHAAGRFTELALCRDCTEWHRP